MSIESELILQSISLSGNVNYVSSLKWSADNKISLSTDKGIHIMMSYCSPTDTGCSLSLHKQFIPLPQETLAFNLYEQRAKLHSLLNKDDLHTLMLDHTLSPKTCNASNFLMYKSVAWASLGSAGYKRCLLATLTLDHRLTIYQDIKDKWQPVADISNNLYEIYQKRFNWDGTRSSGISNPQQAKQEFETLKEKAYSLAAVEIVWTQLFNMNGGNSVTWSYLVSAMKNGNINFWKIQTGSEMKVDLVMEWNSSLGMAKSLYWQAISPMSGFLVVGLIKGPVFALHIKVVSSSDEIKLRIMEPIHLWKDEDNIPVDKVISLKQNRKSYIVVCAKRNYLVGCSMSYENKELSLKIVNYTPGEHSLPITGMCLVAKTINQQQFLLTSLDGKVFQVETDLCDEEVKFNMVEIKLPVNKEKMVPREVTSSPNGVLHAVLYNMGCMFDHLVIRDPLRLIIFSTASVESLSEQLVRQTRGYMPLPLCSNNADVIDCLRSHLALGKPLPQGLHDILSVNVHDQSLYSLQLVWYFMKVALLGSSTVDLKIENMESRLEEVEKHLLKKHCLNVCFLAATRQDQLGKQQRLSFSLMSEWLQKTFEVVVTETEEDWEMSEHCPVCNLKVPFENYREGTCSSNHKFARCCLSFLLVGSANSYLKCPSCRAMALTENIWNLKPHCTYCGCLLKSIG